MGEDSREKQEAELLKLELENDKLRLENKTLEQKMLGKEKPSRWEMIRTSVTWIGVIVPALIVVFTYTHQRSVELEQKATEAHDRRVREMTAATELMEKGDRSAGTLQLSLYGKDAIPLILGEVRVRNFHQDWPSTTLAALVSLKRIGINNLKPEDIEFLRHQGDIAVESLRGYKPNSTDMRLQDGHGMIRIWVTSLY
jgi:hypothetical protein